MTEINKQAAWVHQSPRMQKDEWLTPPHIIRALGDFDLDPCSPINRPWETAKKHLTIDDDGLSADWSGRVWCNPPYGMQTSIWMKKMAQHGNGIALIFARTDTKMFFASIWNSADAVLFLDKRLYFHHVSGEVAKKAAGAPSVLVAYGKENANCLKNCSLNGKFIELKTYPQ